MKDDIKNISKHSLTFMSFFIKAFSMSLLEFPIINSTYD